MSRRPHQDTLAYLLPERLPCSSGQHPEEIQHTLCEMCGDPSDEMDHRLAIEVARALGPAAMLRAFAPDNLRWLCRSFWRHARLTGTLRNTYSEKTAGGRWRLHCLAA